MKRLLRKLLFVLIFGAAGAAAFRALARSKVAPDTASTDWPPFERRPDPTHDKSTADGSTDVGPAKTGALGALATEAEQTHVLHARHDSSTAEWRDSEDGRCLEGYPIKVNLTSGIFHVPGGRFYERTLAQRCYASTDAAERDGYRQAKA